MEQVLGLAGLSLVDEGLLHKFEMELLHAIDDLLNLNNLSSHSMPEMLLYFFIFWGLLV